MTTDTEQRSIENPAKPLTAENLTAYIQGEQDTDAGVSVNENKSLSASTVWAAVSLLAGAVGMLPMHVFRKRKQGGREELSDHPVAILVDLEPNPDMTSQILFEALMTNTLLYGAGFAVVERESTGKVMGLIPVHTQDVSVRRRNGRVEFVFDARRGEVVLNPLDTIYIPGLTWEGIVGMNPVRRLRNAIGTGLAGESRSAGDFKNRSTPAGVLRHPAKLSKDAYERLRDSWDKRYGGAANTGKTAILEEGMEFSGIAFNAEESQALETRKFQAVEVARIFGVPPTMIYELDRATWNNTEQMGLQFVTYSLSRWLVRIEKEFRRKLFGVRERRNHFVKFNANALLRGDAQTRGDFYGKLWNTGAISINEIRALEEMNPVENGDDHFIPLNMQKLGEDPPEPAPEPAAGTDIPAEAPASEDDTAERWAASEWDRIFRMEKDRLEAAARKHLIKNEDRQAFRDWAVTFYGDLVEQIEERLIGPIGNDASAMAAAFGVHRVSRIDKALKRDDPGNYILKAVRDANGTKVQL